jgi:hypothetical protein
MNTKISKLKSQIRIMLVFFIVALMLSGATAIPVVRELEIMLSWLPPGGIVSNWLQKVYDALAVVNSNFPFLLYGYDWLAFGHFAIAVSFFGPLRNPVKNIWVIEFGMIACALIIPYAFACSLMRGIPLGWTLIDCSFGVFGFIPLWICHKKIVALEKLMQEENLNLIF